MVIFFKSRTQTVNTRKLCTIHYCTYNEKDTSQANKGKSSVTSYIMDFGSRGAWILIHSYHCKTSFSTKISLKLRRLTFREQLEKLNEIKLRGIASANISNF